MKKTLSLMISAAVAAISFVPFQAITAAGYGAAGCGLGSIVFGSKPAWFKYLP